MDIKHVDLREKKVVGKT